MFFFFQEENRGFDHSREHSMRAEKDYVVLD